METKIVELSVEQFLQGKDEAQRKEITRAVEIIDHHSRRLEVLDQEGKRDRGHWWTVLPLLVVLVGWSEGATISDCTALLGWMILLASVVAVPVLLVRNFLRFSEEVEFRRQAYEADKVFRRYGADYRLTPRIRQRM